MNFMTSKECPNVLAQILNFYCYSVIFVIHFMKVSYILSLNCKNYIVDVDKFCCVIFYNSDHFICGHSWWNKKHYYFVSYPFSQIIPNFLHFEFMQTEKQGFPYTQQGDVNAGILVCERFF